VGALSPDLAFRSAAVTIWYVDIMWAMMLSGTTLFLGCFIAANRAMAGMRTMGLVTSYGIGLWMAIALPWRVALGTWGAIAAACGVVVFLYELWARRRYAGTGRKERPLILLQGFLLFPVLIPDVMEGMCVDLGILPPSPEEREAEPVR
jgi:hypothetical protein